MACFAIVTLKDTVSASVEELTEAAKARGYKVTVSNKLAVYTSNGINFFRTNEQSPWSVNVATYATHDHDKFKQQVARSKIFTEARRLGYQVTTDTVQGANKDQLVIKLKIG